MCEFKNKVLFQFNILWLVLILSFLKSLKITFIFIQKEKKKSSYAIKSHNRTIIITVGDCLSQGFFAYLIHRFYTCWIYLHPGACVPNNYYTMPYNLGALEEAPLPKKKKDSLGVLERCVGISNGPGCGGTEPRRNKLLSFILLRNRTLTSLCS